MLGLGVTFRGARDKLLWRSLQDWLRSLGSFPLLCIPMRIAFLVLFCPSICCPSFCLFSYFCLPLFLFFPFPYKCLLQAGQLTLSLTNLHRSPVKQQTEACWGIRRGLCCPQSHEETRPLSALPTGPFFFLTILRCGGGGSCFRLLRKPNQVPR